jgi:hypothetical protein
VASPAIRRFRHRAVGVVLRTPLHRTLSRRFLLLRGVGDGVLDPPIALRYAAHESDLVVVAGPGSTWWRPLSAASPTPCAVRHAGREVVLPAVLAAGELLDESILRYLQKYPGEWRALGVDGAASADDVEQAARGQAVIRFEGP